MRFFGETITKALEAENNSLHANDKSRSCFNKKFITSSFKFLDSAPFPFLWCAFFKSRKDCVGHFLGRVQWREEVGMFVNIWKVLISVSKCEDCPFILSWHSGHSFVLFSYCPKHAESSVEQWAPHRASRMGDLGWNPTLASKPLRFPISYQHSQGGHEDQLHRLMGTSMFLETGMCYSEAGSSIGWGQAITKRLVPPDPDSVHALVSLPFHTHLAFFITTGLGVRPHIIEGLQGGWLGGLCVTAAGVLELENQQ